MSKDAINTMTTTLLHSNGRWPSDVMLWHVQIPLAPTAWNLLRVCLSDDEQQRALRYQRDADRLRFAATRVALRALLSKHTSTVPLSLRFSSGIFGRPELTGYGNTLSFNVTHAGQNALIAISERRCVGVDIEYTDRVIAWQALLETVCTTDERHALLRSSLVHGTKGFLRCWTAKEAVLKALGTGIKYGLQQISVDPFAQGVQYVKAPVKNIRRSSTSVLQLHWIDNLVSYVGCIAFGPLGSIKVYLQSTNSSLAHDS
ncbi:4'-phosphopantetheinyl transferase family protein [Candidatus Vallotiella sp. (ex Adelges kitamiensis)]|uniref:4'-phosphopantetheinyl transferase family protein n=1 Tax=Candidatus Vallotiella sp. (ex Adelges kitamiensis) TaxID=2864217 RepID=UPI001CE263E4|nr:4'-phosphopantetheinyl transferase superfamily protein [Candidatus Vallotia sp. (ex Adelges kitamiensis)]